MAPLFMFTKAVRKILGICVFTHDGGCVKWEGGARVDPRRATCRGDSHRGGLCPDRGRARWVALMVQTDKGVRSDSLAFNSRHNTASAATAAADGPAQTCSGARPSARRLSRVNPRSDYEALSAAFILLRSARPPTYAATDAVPRLAGCWRTST